MGSMRDVCRSVGTLAMECARTRLALLQDVAEFPPTAVLLAMLLFIDVLMLDPASLVGGLRSRLLGPCRTSCHSHRPFERLQVNRRSDGTLAAHAAAGAWPTPDDETEVGLFFPTSRHSKSGSWGLTSSTSRYELAQIDSPSVLGTPLEAEVRRVICESRSTFVDHRAAEAAEMIVKGDTTVRTVLPAGYVHNCASGAAGLMLAYAIGHHGAEMLRRRASRRRVRAGVCPNCSYECSGNPTPQCPECGVDTRIVL